MSTKIRNKVQCDCKACNGKCVEDKTRKRLKNATFRGICAARSIKCSNGYIQIEQISW